MSTAGQVFSFFRMISCFFFATDNYLQSGCRLGAEQTFNNWRNWGYATEAGWSPNKSRAQFCLIDEGNTIYFLDFVHCTLPYRSLHIEWKRSGRSIPSYSRSWSVWHCRIRWGRGEQCWTRFFLSSFSTTDWILQVGVYSIFRRFCDPLFYSPMSGM